MKEKSEVPQIAERFPSDHERLRFIVGSIRDLLRGAYREPREQLQKVAKEKDTREVWELRNKLEKRIDKTMTLALDTLRGKLGIDTRLDNDLPEVNALIEAVRIMLIQKSLVRYKEYQLATNAPKLSSAEVKKQDVMREDITEGRALLQWHILQNEGDQEYLKDFLSALNTLWYNEGFADEKGSFVRGLVKELGVYKLLKKHFPKITPASPKEDAHCAIDFWVETKTGRKLMIQSKSSSMFGRGGVFNEQQARELRQEIERQPDANTDYYVDWEGQEHISSLVRAKRAERDFVVAKKYAAEQGVENSELFFVVSSSGNFEPLTGEPKPQFTRGLERQLELLAAS